MPFTIADLDDFLAQRSTASPDESYTARLLSKGPAYSAKKLGEEAVEAVIAAVQGDCEGVEDGSGRCAVSSLSRASRPGHPVARCPRRTGAADGAVRPPGEGVTAAGLDPRPAAASRQTFPDGRFRMDQWFPDGLGVSGWTCR